MAKEESEFNIVQNELDRTKKKLESFIEEAKRNDFSARKDFNKAVAFNTSMQIPVLKSLPATCRTGEMVMKSGKVYACTSPDTWVVVGTQT